MDIKSIQMFATTGGSLLTVVVNQRPEDISELVMNANEGGYELEIVQKKQKRSLDANGYAWVLIDKLAKKLHTNKSDIYRNAIRDIGGVSELICIKEDAAESMKQIWESRGIGWQVEQSPSKIKGCVNLTLYYGSSVYDTSQMSALIDELISECKAQGIETLTPMELERLKGYGI